MTQIANALDRGFIALDAVGPYESLRFVPGAEVVFGAERRGPVSADCSALSLVATHTYDEVCRPDVVVVPGGPGTQVALSSQLVPWLRAVYERSTWTTSVCSGALILGAAGLLAGAPATTRFAVMEHLARFGAQALEERIVVVPERHIITSAGVSAGIDMGLRLVGELARTLTA